MLEGTRDPEAALRQLAKNLTAKDAKKSRKGREGNRKGKGRRFRYTDGCGIEDFSQL
jgi:hypothetical protein